MKKLVVILCLVAGACSSDTGTRVAMTGHEFDPGTLTVSAGDTVVWANESDESHTVTAAEQNIPDGADYFSSGGAPDEDAAVDSLTEELVDPGDAFEWTFEEPGTYRYYCIPHRADGMEGTIVVEE